MLKINAQKMKFSSKDFFSTCDQIRCFLRIWSRWLKKSLMENFIFCVVNWNKSHYVNNLRAAPVFAPFLLGLFYLMNYMTDYFLTNNWLQWRGAEIAHCTNMLFTWVGIPCSWISLRKRWVNMAKPSPH